MIDVKSSRANIRFDPSRANNHYCSRGDKKATNSRT